MSAPESIASRGHGKKRWRPPQVDGLSRAEGRAATLVIALVVGAIALTPGPMGAPTIIGWDKLDHLAAFSALTLVARSGWPAQSRWIIAIFAFAYGIAIELGQSLEIIGRTASVFDLIANAFGIGLGLCIAWILARLRSLLP